MSVDLLIGELAAKTGLDRKTIRYYEEVGLLPRPRRRRTGYASAGYRLYSEEDVERLRLIKGARLLDLPLGEIKQLLRSLNGAEVRPSLRQLLEEKLAALDRKMRDLQVLRDRIEHVLGVIAQEKVEVRESCCEPVCGPEICPPPLVKLKGTPAGRGR